MNHKLIITNLLLAVFVVGCSESGYTPNSTLPVNNTGINNPQNMYQPTNNQPFENQQGMWNQQPYQPSLYQNYQAQGMLSWNMRWNMPHFYMKTWSSRSCFPQKPYVTHCQQQTVRRTCPTTTTPTTPATTPTTATETPVVVSNPPSTNPTLPPEETTKVLPISWANEDAKALYQRLTREEETVKKGGLFSKSVKARTGDHYKCVVGGSENKAKNYVCDLEIRLKDGMLMQQVPVGKTDQAEITNSTMYKGDLLNIGMPGEAPETGYLTISGKSTQYLFQNLPVEAITGKVDEAGIKEAKIKTLGQVKCYQYLGTTETITECVLKIDSSNGKALTF